MPENPLLPHRKLSELYLRMLRCRELERELARQRGAAKKFGAREALLAATSIQLSPGDLLCSEAGDISAEELAPLGKDGKTPGSLNAAPETRLITCAGAARGIAASVGSGLVLAYTRAGSTEPGWAEALGWAHEQRAPLIVVCEDAANGGARGKTKPDTLSWPAMQKLAKKLRLPILAVDGGDAVAVYRVMQESVIRARHNDGPAVIWAVTSPKSAKLPSSQQPLGRLKSYLKTRSIPLPTQR